MQRKNTTSLIVICNGAVLLRPSTAEHKKDGQLDPPSCSACFDSEQERIMHITGNLLSPNFSGKNFRNHFHLVETPIKFQHKDELGEKLFTGYVAIAKKSFSPETLVNGPAEWRPLSAIENGDGISSLFKRAFTELHNSLQGYLKRSALQAS